MLTEPELRSGGPLLAVLPEREVVHPRDLGVDTLRCLVLSSDFGRRELLARAAAQAGWHVAEVEDADQAWKALGGAAFHLAVIDLQGNCPWRHQEARGLCEQLATHHQRLLWVCGDAADPLEEIWARRLGTWMYVPGLSDEVPSEELGAVYDQAREVLGRWHPKLVSRNGSVSERDSASAAVPHMRRKGR